MDGWERGIQDAGRMKKQKEIAQSGKAEALIRETSSGGWEVDFETPNADERAGVIFVLGRFHGWRLAISKQFEQPQAKDMGSIGAKTGTIGHVHNGNFSWDTF